MVTSWVTRARVKATPLHRAGLSLNYCCVQRLPFALTSLAPFSRSAKRPAARRVDEQDLALIYRINPQKVDKNLDSEDTGTFFVVHH